ncbi:MAG: universal stress protein [Euryarchaeota archaeon]|nr:universal stress protein [Euryarchaeota archaeon]
MFRKILFPTDFSEGAMRAIQRFEKENTVEVKECIMLHVIDEGIVEELVTGYSLMYQNEKLEVEDIIKRLKDTALKKLEERKERCREMMHAKSVKLRVTVGIPHEEIVKIAEEENVSVILMPSHGRLGFSRELMGSTTIRVLRKTRKPVLVIKTHKGE